MDEVWREIHEFPSYEVSNHGRIRNGRTGRILALRQNQQGITMINFSAEGVMYTRSVALLVAEAFLPEPPSLFTSVINLDGDRTNNHANNLMWRPRWFAVQYHRQLKRRPQQFNSQIVLIDTFEVFDHPREAAMKYGLLERDIIMDLHNQKGVWPDHYEFRYFKE